ncbi:hypothetical protein FLK61_29940 [Paenalkalicoccus suaedae]|uniref:Uncharacterized protein n=1 Tax=Paenalkalicoccus suaedae TaxID=2592382 RepID=A0A859FFD7_9BACI|nr:hypothetical protein [Paenalkalicoccus suaedae]QKS70946.1 hypothetical protein FLK61_29940 [Paenalkalicoccus suaedae]
MLGTVYTTHVWSEALFIIWLLVAGYIYIAKYKRAGFEVLYLTILSLSIGYAILLYFPAFATATESVPFTHPHIQATMTLLAFLFPLIEKRSTGFILLFIALAISLLYLFVFQASVFSIAFGILIGGFISFVFYRNLDWLGSMPEPLVLVFAIILPVFLMLLLAGMPYLILLPGILLGAGIGYTIERYKLRLELTFDAKSAVIGFSLIAVLVVPLLYFLRPAIAHIPFMELSIGIVIGFWMMFIVPFVLLLLNLATKQGNEHTIS